MKLTSPSQPSAYQCVRLVAAAMLAFLGVFALFTPARADIAPPRQPPGASLLPGSRATQVQMLAETVTLAVQPKSSSGSAGQVEVTAEFQMRNLGSTAEQMAVRFPLTFFDGASDGFFRYPEIEDLAVQVDDRATGTRRVLEPYPGSYYQTPVPWASFGVTFPPGENVDIRVTYTGEGTGEYPLVAFQYILETGAGWKDVIGSADVILRLPYEANNLNVLLEGSTGFSTTTPGAVLEGNEVRWHFENLEPTADNNIEVSLVMPEAWQRVLAERATVKKSPSDGEAWGRLGKAYKEISRLRRGLREDPGGEELYRLSLESYQKCLQLKPKDSLWHTGYADLLWFYYYWQVYWTQTPDTTELAQAVQELKTALELDPKNKQAQDMLADIGASLPGVVEDTGSGYDYLILTATPDIWPATPEVLVETSVPTETQLSSPTATAVFEPTLAPPTEPPPTKVPHTDTPAPVVQAPTLASTAAQPTSVPSAVPAPVNEAQPAPPANSRNCGLGLILPLALGWLGMRKLRTG